MKKKKVTAPLSYDPGKGRPKEHLAYLNWQEMEALKRLNGNNMERGPRGLPSFPPADAIGSSSKASSSKSSKSTGSYTGGGKMGKSSSQAGAQKSSQQGSNVGAQKSSQQGAARSTNKASAGAAKSTAGTAKASQAAEQKAQRAGTQKASAPKAQTGTTKTVNVGPMGTPVSVKTGGTQIKGAIQRAKAPVNYTSAPRYRQPQAERMANPTAIPTAERSVYERMTAADAQKSVKAALDARIQRANQARQAEIARAGLFGAPSYTGTYNPKTGKFDARPTAATASQTVDRTGKVNYGPVLRSGTETMWGGPAVDVANRAGKVDLPAREPSIGETVSDYAGRAYDAVYGGIRAIGEALPPNVFTPRSPSTFTDKIGPRLAYGAPIGPQRPEPSQTVYKNAALSAEEISGAPYGRVGNADPAALDTYSDSVPLGSFTPPTREIDLTQEAYNRAMSGNIMRNQYAVDVRKDALSRINEALDYYKNLGEKPPAAKTRGLTIQPMGVTLDPEEKILAVEDVPPDMLNYPRVKTTENILPFQPRTYDVPYPLDENGVPIQSISEADRAKISARRRGEEYVQTPDEKKASLAAKVVSKIVTKDIPFADKFFNAEENVKDYQARPSWEKDYIKQRAAASGGIGDIGAARSSDERGLASGVSAIPTAAPVAAPTSTASSGTRPEIHYYWDLGLNIPSPTDPNYTQYQEYLRQRTASRAAMYGTS